MIHTKAFSSSENALSFLISQGFRVETKFVKATWKLRCFCKIQKIYAMSPYYVFPKTIVSSLTNAATCFFRTYLRLPWRPLIAIRGNTTYDLNEDFKVWIGKIQTCKIIGLLYVRGELEIFLYLDMDRICSGDSAL
jgi:hypothetical protein